MLARMKHVTDSMAFRIPAEHPSLPGHFPGRPVVPGVVLLDRVLEAIERVHPTLSALRLPQVKFLRPLLPEQDARIELESECGGDQATPVRWRFRILRDDETIARGEVVAG